MLSHCDFRESVVFVGNIEACRNLELQMHTEPYFVGLDVGGTTMRRESSMMPANP
jgi:hypothetical protein